MARNQTVKGSFVASKSVPVVTLVWAGQAKPRGQRDAANAVSRWGSVPYAYMNSVTERPGRIRTRLIAMTKRRVSWFYYPPSLVIS